MMTGARVEGARVLGGLRVGRLHGRRPGRLGGGGRQSGRGRRRRGRHAGRGGGLLRDGCRRRGLDRGLRAAVRHRRGSVRGLRRAPRLGNDDREDEGQRREKARGMGRSHGVAGGNARSPRPLTARRYSSELSRVISSIVVRKPIRLNKRCACSFCAAVMSTTRGAPFSASRRSASRTSLSPSP